jgi:hypothetical protein
MNKHDVDGVSLGFGAVYLGFTVLWLATRLIDVRMPSAGWILAGALLAFGFLGVALTLVQHAERTHGGAPDPNVRVPSHTR